MSTPATVDETPTLRPPLKWAGGKRWLVPLLRRVWANHASARLVEPFCGGLAVALGLDPARALLNDSNPHPVNFYRHLQRGLRVRIAMRNEADLYYRHREEFNRLVTGRGALTRKAAEIFYYLNRTGYNGLCRFNRSGQFNVPFGRYESIRYRRDLREYAPVLSKWSFTTGDFETLELAPGDFLYANPPYDVPFTQYAAGGFGWDDQTRLADWLALHPGPVIASNQATERIEELYRERDFEIHLVTAPRMINNTGDRTPAREILASRNLNPPPGWARQGPDRASRG